MKAILKQISFILDKKQKKKIPLLIIMMLLGGILEALGVSIIIPFVAAITNNDKFNNNNVIRWIYSEFPIINEKIIIVLMLVGLIVIYIIKNLYLFLMNYVQYKYIYSNQNALMNKLLSIYLKKPYDYFLNTNVAQVSAVITTDVPATFTALTNAVLFFSDLVICIFLFGLLLVTDIYMTLIIAAILGITMLEIRKRFKPVSKRIGEETRTNYINMAKCINQSVHGIKDVKVLQKEDSFMYSFQKNVFNYTQSLKKNALLGQIPRSLIETVSIISVAIYLIIVTVLGKNLSNMLPQISAFALAIIRLMPSANRISNYINGMAYLSVSVNKVYEEVLSIQNSHEEASNSKSVKSIKFNIFNKIELKNIEFNYPGSEMRIFEKANMQIPIGKSIGIIGESGAGKSTIVDILLGLLVINSGEILIDNKSIFTNYRGWLSEVGYIPQMIYMLDDTIMANITFNYNNQEEDKKRLWEVLEEAQLADFVRELPEGINTTIGERGVRLSGGQRQRIGIARALYHNPSILIFDEATSALDGDTENAIIESIEKMHGKKTMIIIAHRLATIRGCDAIYKVENKTIKVVDKDSLHI
ncbi:MAG TPA: ABC transporter ATP-binding protein [Sedimentibacter sp.]|nr:ABC transporter ATP-binding protein [Sedimentibacter sp.]